MVRDVGLTGDYGLAMISGSAALEEPGASPRTPLSPAMATTLGVLNGLVGDYLRDRNNGLALEMELIRAGRSLACERAALRAACPGATPRLALFIHGLTESERVWHFEGDPATSYGALLERDLGFTSLELRYNSGLHISENGERLDRLLESLVASWPSPSSPPVSELVLVGHSMGGLLARSACHAAELNGHRWLASLRRVVYVATPHLGAPMEKLGRVVQWLLRNTPNAHARLVADVADLRSAGVKDLGHACLVAADWEESDPHPLRRKPRQPVPAPAHAAHHAVGGTITTRERHLLARLLGDGLVRLPSAMGRGTVPHLAPPFAPEDVRVFPGVGHRQLAHHPEVYAQLRAWCER